MHEWEDLGNVDVCHGVHDGVEEVVDEYHSDDGCSGRVVPGLSVVGRSASPAGKEGGHADESNEVLPATGSDLGYESRGDTSNEIPALFDFELNSNCRETEVLTVRARFIWFCVRLLVIPTVVRTLARKYETSPLPDH